MAFTILAAMFGSGQPTGIVRSIIPVHLRSILKDHRQEATEFSVEALMAMIRNQCAEPSVIGLYVQCRMVDWDFAAYRMHLNSRTILIRKIRMQEISPCPFDRNLMTT